MVKLSEDSRRNDPLPLHGVADIAAGFQDDLLVIGPRIPPINMGTILVFAYKAE